MKKRKNNSQFKNRVDYISSLLYIKYVKKGNEQEVYNEDGMYKITKEDRERAAANGINYALLYQRVNIYFWDIERAINEPKYRNMGRKTNKYTKEQVRIAESNGISKYALSNRVNQFGWDIEDAITIPPGTRRNGEIVKYTQEDIKRAKAKGIKKGTFCCRVSRYGWTVEEAINTPVSKRRVN